MPSWICNQDGTALISPIGGTVQAWYHDYMDAYGRSVIVGSTVASPRPPQQTNNPQPQGTGSAPTLAPAPQAYAAKITHVTQIGNANGTPLVGNPKVGQTMTFNDIISNGDYQKGQSISYIVQVKDGEGKVVYLKWISDTVGPAGQVREQLQWTPSEPGSYSVQAFVWDGMDSLVPLTVQNGYYITVAPQ